MEKKSFRAYSLGRISFHTLDLVIISFFRGFRREDCGIFATEFYGVILELANSRISHGFCPKDRVKCMPGVLFAFDEVESCFSSFGRARNWGVTNYNASLR